LKLLNGSGFELALTGGILTDGKVNLNSYLDGNNISYVDVIVGRHSENLYI
jgi:hypothetical protein